MAKPQRRTVHIHLLVLSLVYRGVSLPLYWVNLAKKGHSSQRERIRLIQQANKLYSLKGMCILADREYVGKDCGAARAVYVLDPQ